jgi:hypothetical protein
LTLDRDLGVWVGVLGNEFIIMTERHMGMDRTVRTSNDGVRWSDPIPVVGLPEMATITRNESGLALVASTAGLIGLFELPPDGGDGPTMSAVFTSIDGTNWVREEIADIGHSAADAAAFGVAANDTEFAVLVTEGDWGFGPDYFAKRSAEGSEWMTVGLPGEDTDLFWVAGAEDAFFVRGPGSEEFEHGHIYVYRVDADGSVSVQPATTYDPPIPWKGDLLAWDRYRVEGHPTLHAGPDGSTWYRLPIPTYEDDAYGNRWLFETLSVGSEPIIAAGCVCSGFWEFYGEAFPGINLTKGSNYIEIHGDHVHPVHPSHSWYTDTSQWFDASTGTLNVPDPETGETFVSVTCAEMREAVTSEWYQEDLVDFPQQDLWYSPDGTNWFGSDVADLFGAGSYVLHSAMRGDTAVVITAPNGARPTSDPPGCPLGLWPEEEPFEVWVMGNGS